MPKDRAYVFMLMDSEWTVVAKSVTIAYEKWADYMAKEYDSRAWKRLSLEPTLVLGLYKVVNKDNLFKQVVFVAEVARYA